MNKNMSRKRMINEAEAWLYRAVNCKVNSQGLIKGAQKKDDRAKAHMESIARCQISSIPDFISKAQELIDKLIIKNNKQPKSQPQTIRT